MKGQNKSEKEGEGNLTLEYVHKSRMRKQLHSVSHTKQPHCSGKPQQNRKLLSSLQVTLGSNWHLYHVNAITETGIQKINNNNAHS